MKRFLLISVLMSSLPLTFFAQDDDMYFVPTKKNVEQSKDDYYRRNSHYEPISDYSAGNDIIDFNNEIGVYPDSLGDDFAITRQMSRWDGYTPSDAYWEGYDRGRSDGWSVSVWHSPWYYSSYYPWYDSYYWYDPWYHTPWSWHVGYYDPWYYRHYGWGWGSYYWHRPYYHRHYTSSMNRSRHSTIGAGTINRYGYTHNSGGSYRSSSTGSMRNNSNSVNPNRNRSYNSNVNSGRSNNSNSGSSRSFSYGSSSRSSVGSSGSYSSGGSSRSGSMGGSSRSGSMGGGTRSGGSSRRR